jgi:predicted MFS family arabinose efflux permease
MKPEVKSEFKQVGVLSLGFGLVGIDRYLITPLFPIIARDLHLGYGDIGTIAGALAIAWSFAALLMGNLSDRVGRRRVLVGSLILFGLLIGASGLATGLMGLVAVRLVMGFADGAFTPASISATIEASPRERHGRNIGIQQMTLTLFGLGFAPLAVAGLLHVMDWRLIFSVFAIPGFILAWMTWRTLPAKVKTHEEKRSSIDDWKRVLSYPNIRVLTLLMLCCLVGLVTTSTFAPSFLLDHLHVNASAMSIVVAAIGLGAAAGALVLPWISDKIGRKPVMMISFAGACLTLLVFNHLGPNVVALFVVLFLVQFFNNAMITLIVGPLCSETVPPQLMATASGMVIAVGELFGGGLGTVIAGQAAEHFKQQIGIGRVLYIPVAALVVGFLVCTQLRETLPAKVGVLQGEPVEVGSFSSVPEGPSSLL